MQARADGLDPTEAAKAAGYANPYSAAFKLSRNQSLIQMNQIVMAAHGLDLPAFVQTLKGAFTAEKLVKATFQGEITDTMNVPDWDIRLRALEIAIDLTGIKPADERRLVVEDEAAAGAVNLVPDDFNQLDSADLLRALQRRREAITKGVPLPEDRRIAATETDDDDIDDRDPFDDFGDHDA